MFNALNKWDYSQVDEVQFSDKNQESYKKAAEFLGDDPVEDWGGGTGWAGHFIKNYRNIDAGTHKRIDETVDIVNYRSNGYNILMREVLEYIPEWKRVLENVKASFKDKFCLIISTPFADETHISAHSQKDVPEIRFKKQDILDEFKEYKTREELIKTDHLYNQDWILYVEKNNS